MPEDEPKSGVHYSDAYEKLIKNDDDLIGHLSYSFYKKQKKELIVKNKLDKNSDHVLNYHFDLGEDRINTLRIFAEKRLNDYADKVADSLLDEEKQKARSDELLTIMLAEFKKGTALSKSVFVGVASSFVFALILSAANLIQWNNPFNFLLDSEESASKEMRLLDPAEADKAK